MTKHQIPALKLNRRAEGAMMVELVQVRRERRKLCTNSTASKHH